MNTLLQFSGTAFGMLAISCTALSAHDLRGIVVEHVDGTYAVIASAIAQTPIADEASRSVLNNLVLWPVPRKLSICFVSGDLALRKSIVDAMRRQWDIAALTDKQLEYDPQSFTSLPDCGATPKADLRVGFKKGGGHWSYVGTYSLKKLPSMNFGGFDTAPPGATEFDRIVGHELGHALGLEHEHQSPKAKCKWDYEFIYGAYVWDNKEDMRVNLDALQDYIKDGKHAYSYLPVPDKLSAMHYWFPPEAFIDKAGDACYISAKNNFPSNDDEDAIRIAYGPKAKKYQELTRSLSTELLDKFSSDEFQKLRELINAKVELLKNTE